MKFIFFTDTHVKGVNPGRRKDIYYLAILKKLWELKGVIEKENIDFVVHGGDLFDVPKVSNKLFGQVASIFKSYKKKIFVVPGNHDVYGQNIDTIDHTSLGALAKTGVVELMTRAGSPYYFQIKSDPNCPLLAITAQEYYGDIDKGINDDYDVELSAPGSIPLLVAHGMLMDGDFHPDVPHTNIKNVITSAKAILSGHYHPGPTAKEVNGTLYLNPGSTARIEATKHNIDTKPKYVIIEVTNQGISYDIREYQCAEEGKDVFDYDSAIESKQYKNSLESFKKTVKDIDTHDANSINDILTKVSKALGVDKVIINEAIKRITSAQQTESNNALNGYLPKNTVIQIVKVILHNFQSYKHAEVDFDINALNALIGESDNGKTSILRAIKWVLYNEPKGTDFIRNGCSDCYATIVLSNGDTITRRRTQSSAGYYEVYDAQTGKTTKYEGFSHTVPMEIYNTHQMPKIIIGKDQVSLNIAEQLDGAFMLSQSAGDRASFIGKITGVQTVDTAIKEISKDIANIQRDNKSIERDIQDSVYKLEKYNDLQDMKSRIETAEIVIDEIEATEKHIEDLYDLANDINNFNTELVVESDKYERLNYIDKLGGMLLEIELEQEKNLSLKIIESDYLNNATEINTTIAKLASYSNLDELNSFIDIICKEQLEYELLNSLSSELYSVEVMIKNEQEKLSKLGNLTEEFIDEIENTLKEIKELETLKSEYDSYCVRIDDSKGMIEAYDKAMNNTQEKYRKTLKQLGTCPLCSNHLDNDKIDAIEL